MIAIRADDLTDSEIQNLIRTHRDETAVNLPPESRHAFDLSGLRAPDVTFWSVRDGQVLLGCGALKELDAQHGEVKSMHTLATNRRKGVGQTMLQHIADEARRRGYTRLSLETGASANFVSAQSLYSRFGFIPCAPFADYRPDPNSTFMTMVLK
jgi:putative acetyltransferase